jgi:hypothetical protein
MPAVWFPAGIDHLRSPEGAEYNANCWTAEGIDHATASERREPWQALVTCSHPGPHGGWSASASWQGRMKPGGLERERTPYEAYPFKSPPFRATASGMAAEPLTREHVARLTRDLPFCELIALSARAACRGASCAPPEAPGTSWPASSMTVRQVKNSRTPPVI